MTTRRLIYVATHCSIFSCGIISSSFKLLVETGLKCECEDHPSQAPWTELLGALTLSIVSLCAAATSSSSLPLAEGFSVLGF